ncbi:permease-like cell division protein FtsX [Actinoallomurus purpureus]|uniref:permease-like cell division protein FtsX n=1 Tax=Actinoallomurus purpureus TaxID=478114 RepID=UPI002092A698|nr:permease-like cell division protein FtsX [Actinoallomurus purpureus]MCO6009049.1 permease-like cell division protein FtsX [Actinoallomurus purpureus]
MRTLEDRIRDAYAMADEWGPAVPPPLRHRTARRRRLRFAAPLAAAAGVTAVVFLATGLPHGTRNTTAPPQSRPTPTSTQLPTNQATIYLCAKASLNPSCHHQEATPAQRDAIADALRKTPQVRAVEYVTKAEAFAQAKNSLAGTKRGDALRPGDIPASFRVTMRRPADFQAIIKAVMSRPGVDQVVNQPR